MGNENMYKLFSVCLMLWFTGNSSETGFVKQAKELKFKLSQIFNFFFLSTTQKC